MNAVLSYDIFLNHIWTCAVLCSNGAGFRFFISVLFWLIFWIHLDAEL